MVKSDGWTPKNDALDLALEEDKDKEVRAQMTMNATTDFHGFELPLSHQPAAHCENGAISTLLRYYGIELSEPMVFGLASGLFFTHLPFIKMSGMPVTAFRTFPGVLFKRITSLLGIQTETHRYLSKEKAMRQLDQVILEQKKPVGCVVGMFNLPYLPVEYRFHFNGHNICITGKDEKTGDYCVLDSNATQKVTISREDLLKVRFATGGTYPLLGQMYWIKSVPEQLPDLRPLILKSIRKTCWNMVSQPDFIHIAGANGIFIFPAEYVPGKVRWALVVPSRTWLRSSECSRRLGLVGLASVLSMVRFCRKLQKRRVYPNSMIIQPVSQTSAICGESLPIKPPGLSSTVQAKTIPMMN